MGVDITQDSDNISHGTDTVSRGVNISQESDTVSRGPLSVDNDNKENNNGRCIVDENENLRPIIIDGSNVAMRFVPVSTIGYVYIFLSVFAFSTLLQISRKLARSASKIPFCRVCFLLFV